MNASRHSEALLARFLRYAARGTQSDAAAADAGTIPSTETQRKLAEDIATEFRGLGLTDVEVDDNSYLVARVPASPGLEAIPPFGLSAHLDTASDAPGDPVRPIVHRDWDGSPISLADGVVLDPATDTDLARRKGDAIVTSDGTSLLGADDKAGVAEIVTLAEILLSDPSIPHGPIEILLSPDEETGHGMDRVPLRKLKSTAFYTVDGGTAGEIEAECFNAWKVDAVFAGIAAHLGSARGKMVNAVSMAASFVSALPAQESPESTDGRLGYFCALGISGAVERAEVSVFVRDFDIDEMERRLDRLDAIARAVEARYPGGTVTLTRTRQYLNMKRRVDERPEVLSILEEAVRRAGLEPHLKPIRGGTDGSRLTELGIPTPNVFTGGHNYHSRTEWASLAEMTQALDTLVELSRLWAERARDATIRN
jgi:tripeptide aminopeptidase